MALSSNQEWKRWGNADPLWAVSSWDGKAVDSATPWTDEEFYALGASDWGDFLPRWQHYGLTRGTCIEIGCGAGRITKQLAGCFSEVIALDVSEGMVARAKAAILDKNVRFEITEGLVLPVPDASVNAVFSCHVLQHLDEVAIGYRYFREFFRSLCSGGTLMVHLPVYSWPFRPEGKFGNALIGAYRMYSWLDELRARSKRALNRQLMRATNYPLTGLYAELGSAGFKRMEFAIFPTTSNDGLHTFVFAEKP